jgi:hypothetical protein
MEIHALRQELRRLGSVIGECDALSEDIDLDRDLDLVEKEKTTTNSNSGIMELDEAQDDALSESG